MSRTSLQKAVFWAFGADFVLLYLGAVKLDEPLLTLTSLIALGATLVAALVAF